MSEPKAASPLDAKFARKVRASRWALLFERLWPRVWLILGLVGVFLLVSLAGLWSLLSDPAHYVALAAFAIAGIVALLHAVRVPFPSHDEAVRRIERVSGVPHRPPRPTRTPSPPTPTIRARPPFGRHTARGSQRRFALARRQAASAHRPAGSRRPARAARARRRRVAGARRRQRLRPPALRLPFQLGGGLERSAPRRLGDAAVLHRQAAADAGRRRARPRVRRNTAQARRGARAQRAHRAHQRARARRASLDVFAEGSAERKHIEAKKPEAGKSSAPNNDILRDPLRAALLRRDPCAGRRRGAGALGVLREARQAAGHCHQQAGRARAAAR